MNRPEISVIMPAYRAEGTLPRAVASIALCGLPPEAVEIVIASDDRRDYRPLLPTGQRFALTPVGQLKTGPGEARNRALAQARGRFIAFLDADDTWEPGYLACLLPLARRHGAAFGRTSIRHGETEIMRLPPAADTLRLSDLGRYGTSFHPVLARRQARAFSSHPSQDVRHAAELLARLGGAAPLGRAGYQLRLGTGSLTAEPGFAARVAQAYRDHRAEIRQGGGDVPDEMRPRLADIFRDKARLNDAYVSSAEPGESFYDFLARHLDRSRAGAMQGG